MTPLGACDYAVDIIKKVGFVVSHTSMSGETTTVYYAFPGRLGTLRVSTHKARKRKDRVFGDKNCVASLTFSHVDTYSDGSLRRKSDVSVDNQIAYAIGTFFMKAKRVS